MDSLTEYSPYLIPDHLEITGIRSGILYFVHIGRNAWHSTWIQRYYDGCFHETIEGAKLYCESMRKSGTRFYIIETPTLILIAGGKTICITQINVNNPLCNYSPDAVTSVSEYQGDLVMNPKDNYIKKGTLIKDAVLSFDASGRFWRAPPQPNNPVISLISCKGESIISPVGRSELNSYFSSSRGRNYYLSWGLFKISRDPKGVASIVNGANEAARLLAFPIKKD